MSTIIPIFFALLLIFFVVNFDWSKTKMPRWAPFVFVVLLTLYILHTLLIVVDINVIELAKDKDVFKWASDTINKKTE